MIRRIITINKDKCNGCGLCAAACHEGAIGMVNGKAQLLREDYCDGLGDCLPACPTGAISFEEREAPAYNEAAVLASKRTNFPIQIKLVSPNAAWFDNADLLIAADCTAYTYRNFHDQFMKNKVTLIGCPKLDNVNYSEKLAQILSENNIKSITLTRMSVPCCGGMAVAIKNALAMSGKDIPFRIVTITPDGQLKN